MYNSYFYVSIIKYRIRAICNKLLIAVFTVYLFQSTLVQWRTAFWVCFAVLVGTNVIYCIWADGKQQWWDDVRQFGYPENWKHGPLSKENLDKEKSKKKEAEGTAL